MAEAVYVNVFSGGDLTVLHEKWPVKRWHAQHKIFNIQQSCNAIRDDHISSMDVPWGFFIIFVTLLRLHGNDSKYFVARNTHQKDALWNVKILKLLIFGVRTWQLLSMVMVLCPLDYHICLKLT